MNLPVSTPAVERAFNEARTGLQRARDSHTGSWWNASVLRKQATLIEALHNATRFGLREIDLADVLYGTGGYDTAEGEQDNARRDERAIDAVCPLMRTLQDAGMRVNGCDLEEDTEMKLVLTPDVVHRGWLANLKEGDRVEVPHSLALNS